MLFTVIFGTAVLFSIIDLLAALFPDLNLTAEQKELKRKQKELKRKQNKLK